MKITDRTVNRTKSPPVEVFCWLRPEKNVGDLKNIRITSNEHLQVTNQTYKFKHIFSERSSQKDLFNSIAFPLVNDWFHGKNGLLLTYGGTSADKTHIITGDPKNSGLLPRIIDLTFNSLKKAKLHSKKSIFRSDGKNGFVVKSTSNILSQEKRDKKTNVRDSIFCDWKDREREIDFINDLNHDHKYSIFVSYVENYNKYVHDLLDDKQFDQLYPLRIAANKPQAKKMLRENDKKEVYIHDLTEIEVFSAEEALALFLKGNFRKKLASTNLNSHSHSIFTLRLVQAPLNKNGKELISHPSEIVITQLSIVDLAGCKTIQKTGNRMKNISNINSSLLTLRSCLETLRENQIFSKTKKRIPYRDSCLTLLFKSFFESNGQVKMILCLNPRSQDLDETLNVLKFGELSQENMTKKTDFLSRFDPVSRQKFQVFSFSSWPKKWLESPEDDRIMIEWKCINEQQNNKAPFFMVLHQQEMDNIRENILELQSKTSVMRDINLRLKTENEIKNKEFRKLQEKYIVVQEEKEKTDRFVQQAQKTVDDLKRKLFRIENESSKIENDYETLKKNIDTLFESHRKETNKFVYSIMNKAEKKLKEFECHHKKKLENVVKIFEDNDKIRTFNMKNFSTNKIRSAINGMRDQSAMKIRKILRNFVLK